MEVNENKLYSKIGKLIKIIDDLRDIGLSEVMPLPRICVLGAQSTGKSSVLESIIGIDCLPRGEGLVTRRPLELRLVHIPQSQSTKAYAEFEERKGVKIEDFNVVKKTIEELTETVAKGKATIVNKPIKLTIHSTTCPDLTVIDLPGITKVPYLDQPHDIETIIKDMCRFYCSDPSTIILCTIASNVDITTSDALLMARELDPKGERTIGVLTKCDIMDHGSNCKKEVLGEVVPLKNGYVAVKNRSQLDITNGVSVQQALEVEKNFFRTHHIYRSMSLHEYFGTETLIEKLKRLFFDYLKHSLPNIYEDLKGMIKNCQEQLTQYGTDYIFYQTNSSKNQYITGLIHSFTDSVDKIFSGKMPNLADNLTNHHLKLASHDFLNNFKEDYQPGKKMRNEDIIKIIKLTEGDRLGGFPESDVVHTLLQDDLDMLQNEVKQYTETVYQMSVSAVRTLISRIFCRFPNLMESIEEFVNKYIDRAFKRAEHIVNSVADMNFNYLYLDENCLSYESFLEKILVNKEESGQGSSLKSDNDKNFYNGLADYVKTLVNYYYAMILRSIREYVPKAIGFYFIRSFKQEFRFYLLTEITSIMYRDDMMSEDPEVSRKRDYYVNLMKILKASEKALLQDEDIKSALKYEANKIKEEKTIQLGKIPITDSNTETIHKSMQSDRVDTSFNQTLNTKSNNQEFASKQRVEETKIKQDNSKVVNASTSNVNTSNTNPNPNKGDYSIKTVLRDEPAETKTTSKIENTTTSTSTNTNTNTVNSKPVINTVQDKTLKPVLPTSFTNYNQQSNTINNSTISSTSTNSSIVSNNKTTTNSNNASSTSNTNNAKPIDVNFKYDLSSNSIKDVDVKVDAESAFAFYQNNKQYLPSKEQMISGATKAGNFVKDSGVLENDYEIVDKKSAQTKPKSAFDPLTSLFGTSSKKKEPETKTDKPAKKGFF